MRGVVLVSLISIAGLSGLSGCGQESKQAIEIVLDGDGAGWVDVDLGGETITTCKESCEIELPAPEATAKIEVGTTHRITSSSCPGAPRHCELLVGDGQELRFTFEKDPHELATIFLDEAPKAIAFAGNSDLIIATDTSLRRVALDGTEVWRVPRDEETVFVRTGAGGLIAAAGYGNVTAYREDGTFAWKQSAGPVLGLAVGANNDVIMKSELGTLRVMSAVDGGHRWYGSLPLSKDGASGVVADRSGTVIARTGYQDRLIRFTATGAPLNNWSVPSPLGAIEFGPDDQLLGTSGVSYGEVTPVVYTRFDATGAATSFVSGPAYYHGFAPHAYGIFEWRQDAVDAPNGTTSPPLVSTTLTISSLDRNGVVRWEIVKGEPEPDGTSPLRGLSYVSSACDRDGHHCAITGHYPSGWGDGLLYMQYWLAVYTLP